MPRDLSVIGFNDIPEAARAGLPLTTVDGMNAEKGRVAARLVLGAPHPVRREMLAARLSSGKSTAPPPDRR